MSSFFDAVAVFLLQRCPVGLRFQQHQHARTHTHTPSDAAYILFNPTILCIQPIQVIVTG